MVVVKRKYGRRPGTEPRTDLWTTEATQFLKDMHATGLSMGLIAVAMAKEGFGGFTRNAIIGKCTRLGLKHDTGRPHRTKNGKHNGTFKQVPASKPRAPHDPNIQAPRQRPHVGFDAWNAKRKLGRPVSDKPVLPFKSKANVGKYIVEAAPTTSMVLLDSPIDCCKWPTNDDPRAFEVCGQASVRGAYCEHHARIAYSPPKNGHAVRYEARQPKFFREQIEYRRQGE